MQKIFNAIKHNNIDEVKELIKNKKILNGKNNDGETPLIYAVFEDKFDICKVLINAKADLDKQSRFGETALIIAASINDIPVLQKLIEANANLNIQKYDGDTALILAAQYNNLDIVKELIKAKAKLDIQDEDGDTALIRAVHYNNFDIVKELIKANAKLDIQNIHGDTALMIALKIKNLPIVKSLIKANKNLDINPERYIYDDNVREIRKVLKEKNLKYGNIDNIVDIKEYKSTEFLDYLKKNLKDENKKKNIFLPILKKIHTEPLGKNVWYIDAHGITENKIFKTSIPIIFESSLGNSVIKTTKAKKEQRIFNKSLIRKILFLDDKPNNNDNNLKIYREDDLVPEVKFDYLKFEFLVNEKPNNNKISQAGIYHLEDYFKKKKKYYTNQIKTNQPRLNFHNIDTFPNINKIQYLSEVVKILSKKFPNAILVVGACRDIAEKDNYLKEDIHEFISNINKLEKFSKKNNNKPNAPKPNLPKLNKIESLSAKTLNYKNQVDRRINFEKYLMMHPDLFKLYKNLIKDYKSGNPFYLEDLNIFLKDIMIYYNKNFNKQSYNKNDHFNKWEFIPSKKKKSKKKKKLRKIQIN